MTMAGTLPQRASYSQTGIRITMLLALCKEWIVEEFRQLRPGKTAKNKG
jgi:hypothetical protein